MFRKISTNFIFIFYYEKYGAFLVSLDEYDCYNIEICFFFKLHITVPFSPNKYCCPIPKKYSC